MRKKWFFMTILFALIGWGVMAEEINLEGIQHGNYSKYLAEKGVGTVETIVIPNKETATEIAGAIAKNIIEDIDNRSVLITFDDGTNTWIVSFDDDLEKLGGEFSIALQASDGCVIKMWFDE